MNTVLICNLIFLLTLVSVKTITITELYRSFMKIEYEHEQACIKENNVDEAMIEGVITSGVFPDNKNFKCFLNCMLIKSKSINEKGEFNLDNLKELSEDVHITFLEKFMRDCTSKINENDPCERAALIDTCFTEEIKLVLGKQKK